jgi:LPXTG-motif cell wall-anchored protein
MGLIPMGQDPLHAYTGHPISYGGVQAQEGYGRVLGIGWPSWSLNKEAYATCPDYRKHRDHWSKMKGKYKRKHGTAGWGKAAREAVYHLRAIESKGKNAWKACKADKKAGEQGWSQVTTPTFSPEGAGAIDPFTGLPVDGGMSTVSYEEDDGGSNMGLYIGIIALLGATGGLIWYKKKKAKSKGSKR